MPVPEMCTTPDLDASEMIDCAQLPCVADTLPDSLMLSVFSSLTYEELCMGARLVCRRWARLSREPQLWRRLSVPCHYSDDRLTKLLSQAPAAHVESVDCSACESLSAAAFEWIAQRSWPSLRHIAMPTYTITAPTSDSLALNDQLYTKLTRACPQLQELENVMPTSDGGCAPLHVQSCAAQLTVVHDRPATVYGRVPDADKRRQWRSDLTRLAAACPHVHTYRNRKSLGYLDADGLRHLAATWPRLRELDIGYACANDAALSEFMTDAGAALRTVTLEKPGEVGDMTLRAIGDHCHELRRLKLSRCAAVTSAGLTYITERCAELRELHVNNKLYGCAGEDSESPDIDDQCVVQLAVGCPQLDNLRLLNSSRISENALHAVTRDCRRLTGLMLYECARVDDTCLNLLLNLRHLSALVLVNCDGVTPDGVVELALRAPSLGRLTLYSQTAAFYRDVSPLADRVYERIDATDTVEQFRPNVLKRMTLQGVGGAFVQLLTVLCPRLRILDIRPASGALARMRADGRCLATVLRNCEELSVLDVADCAPLGDCFVDALLSDGVNIRRLNLGRVHDSEGGQRVSEDCIIRLISECPSLYCIMMDIQGSSVREEELVRSAKERHGGQCVMHVEPSWATVGDGNNPVPPRARHRYLELYFTPKKFLNSIITESDANQKND